MDLQLIKPDSLNHFFKESDEEENFIDIADDEEAEKFTDADKETQTDTVKKAEMEETESESHVGTRKVECASWVHFDNLKGEFLKSLNFSFESLDFPLILIEINSMHFRSSQYCFLLDGSS